MRGRKFPEEDYKYEVKNKVKYCSSCKEYLPWDKFSPRLNARHKLQNICKPCKNANNNKHYHTRNDKSFNFRRALERIKDYGISIDEFYSILENQNYECAICGDKTDEEGVLSTGRRIGIDHDHVTKVVRGLLCNKCNSALGQLNDSLELLTKAIKYLQDNGIKYERI